MKTIQDTFAGILTIHTPHPTTIPEYRVLDFFYQSEIMKTYLIHLDTPIERANGYKVIHYIGSTKNLERRIREHRRKSPLYILFGDDIKALNGQIPTEMKEILGEIEGRKFRKAHTFKKKIRNLIPDITEAEIRIISKIARRHKGASLLMEANRRKIGWQAAKVWRAGRDFEKYLKARGHYDFWCPICQGKPF
jgi:hypothetical protein